MEVLIYVLFVVAAVVIGVLAGAALSNLFFTGRVFAKKPEPRVSEGVVVSAELRELSQEFTGSDNGQPLPRVVSTWVSLDTGESILVDGDVTGICAKGNRVRISRQGNGPFTIANLTERTPEAK